MTRGVASRFAALVLGASRACTRRLCEVQNTPRVGSSPGRPARAALAPLVVARTLVRVHPKGSKGRNRRGACVGACDFRASRGARKACFGSL
jgi:hypothetical protein